MQYFNGGSSKLGEVEGTKFYGQSIQNSSKNNKCDNELWESLGSFPLVPTLFEEEPQLHYSQTLSKELNHHVEVANQPPVPPSLQNSASSLPVQRKRTTWTDEEHRQFLLALRRHGKGKLVEITKDIGTKSYSQVASHAQKYFKRQDLPREKKKRKSIHDMILEDTNEISYQMRLDNSSANQILEYKNEIPQHIFQPNSTFDFKYTNQGPHRIFQQNSIFGLKYPNEVPPPNIVQQNSTIDPALKYKNENFHHFVQQNSTFVPATNVPHHIVHPNLAQARNHYMLQMYRRHQELQEELRSLIQ